MENNNLPLTPRDVFDSRLTLLREIYSDSLETYAMVISAVNNQEELLKALRRADEGLAMSANNATDEPRKTIRQVIAKVEQTINGWDH